MKITTLLSKEKKRFAKTILLLSFSSLCLFHSNAQTIYVLKKDNASSPTNLTDIKSIHFNEDNCIIKNRRGQTNAFNIDNIKYLSFVNYTLATKTKETINEKSDNMTCFPNPATSVLNVKLKEETENANILIINTSGKVIIKESSSKMLNTINISSLKQGMYLCKITTDELTEIKPFIKQ